MHRASQQKTRHWGLQLWQPPDCHSLLSELKQAKLNHLLLAPGNETECLLRLSPILIRGIQQSSASNYTDNSPCLNHVITIIDINQALCRVEPICHLMSVLPLLSTVLQLRI